MPYASWTPLGVAVIALLASALSALIAARAQRGAQKVERTKVDAQAYERAAALWQQSLDDARTEIDRLRDQVRELRAQLDEQQRSA